MMLLVCYFDKTLKSGERRGLTQYVVCAHDFKQLVYLPPLSIEKRGKALSHGDKIVREPLAKRFSCQVDLLAKTFMTI